MRSSQSDVAVLARKCAPEAVDVLVDMAISATDRKMRRCAVGELMARVRAGSELADLIEAAVHRRCVLQ
jgi:hypothetical protein